MTIRLLVHGERESAIPIDPESGRFLEVYCLTEPFLSQYLGMARTLSVAYNKAMVHDQRKHQGEGQVLICSFPLFSDGVTEVGRQRLKDPAALFNSGQIYPPPDATV